MRYSEMNDEQKRRHYERKKKWERANPEKMAVIRAGKWAKAKLRLTEEKREELRVRQATYYATNKEKISAKAREKRITKKLTDPVGFNVARKKSLAGQRKRRKDNPEHHSLKDIKSRAKLKGRSFNIELEDIATPPLCALLGLPLVRHIGSGCAGPNSPSVDCIIPALGYVKGNVQVISNRANVLKRDATLEELVLMGEWAKKMIAARKP